MVTNVSSALGYVLERPWRICGLLGLFTYWLLALEWDYQKDSGLIPTDQDHSSRADPFVGLLLVSVSFHNAGRSRWDKFMSLLWQQLSNAACFAAKTAKSHTSFKNSFTKYVHNVSNTCCGCVMVKQICPRKAKFRTVLCLRVLDFL